MRLLHNSIYAEKTIPLSDTLADIAWAQMRGSSGAWQFLRLMQPVSVRPGDRDRVHVDETGNVVLLESSDPHVPWLNRRATVVYLGAEVWCRDHRLGHAVTEVYANLDGGMATPLDDLAQRTFVMRADHVSA